MRGNILIYQAIDAVVVFTITAALTYAVTCLFRRCGPSAPNGRKGDVSGKNRVADGGEGDSHDEADDEPLCKAGQHPLGKSGSETEHQRDATGAVPHKVLLRDDIGRMLFSDNEGHGRGETRDTSLGLWGMRARRMLLSIGLGRNTIATSGTSEKYGVHDRVPGVDQGSVVSSYNRSPADGRVKTDNTAPIATFTTNNGSGASGAPKLSSARAVSAETFMKRPNRARDNNTVFAPVSSWGKRGSEFWKGGRGHKQNTPSGGEARAAKEGGIESGKRRRIATRTSGCGESRGTEESSDSAAGGASTSPSSLAFRRALSETSRDGRRAFPTSDAPLPV